ncbi:GGDEF domain-containing protein [Pseudoalteromonas xiamenensis]|uniref:GGDEF domain-containing protein n=1 Tax=Pseudoalteromonas xiamenensis TaxID=882626 RepID=UPI0035E74E2E
MEFEASLAHSAQCLKKAVPLMVKYAIPVTPMNYAIWYCYVSGSQPALNQELDATIAHLATCPPHVARRLFDRYLSERDLALFHELSGSFHGAISTVQGDIAKTLETAQDYSAVLAECYAGLYNIKRNNVESFDGVLNYVERLTAESITMQQEAFSFQKKLEFAYQEITELREALLDSQIQASIDKLTGLYNRGKFDEDVVHFCQSFTDLKQAALIFIDVDHFKSLNDTFGHQTGDETLKKIAAKISRQTEGKGAAYRYGGEEFCILACFSSVGEAVNFVQLLRQDISKLSVKNKEQNKAVHPITASFGMAFVKVDMDKRELIAKADKALYLAKTHGRDRVEIA